MTQADEIPVPEWIYPGARVAIWNGTTGALRIVERLTKTLVILENDDRYRRDGLKRPSQSWSPSWRLMAIDDPIIVEWAQKTRINEVAHRVEDLMQTWRRFPNQIEHVQKASELLSEFLATKKEEANTDV